MKDAAIHCESLTAEIVAVADGVSSCRNGKKGAEIAVKAAAELLLEETEYFFSSEKEKIAGLIVSYIRDKIFSFVEKNNQEPESYASTLSFVCRNKKTNEVMTFLLGDSLIFSFGEKEKHRLACKPVFLNDFKTITTMTENAEKFVDIKRNAPKDISYFVLATDGAWASFYENSGFAEDFKAITEKEIVEYLKKQECKDDCSVAFLNLKKGA